MNKNREDVLKEEIKNSSFISKSMTALGILTSVGTIYSASTKGMFSFDSLLFASFSVLSFYIAREKHNFNKTLKTEVKKLEKTV